MPNNSCFVCRKAPAFQKGCCINCFRFTDRIVNYLKDLKTTAFDLGIPEWGFWIALRACCDINLSRFEKEMAEAEKELNP